jgi:endoglucanase
MSFGKKQSLLITLILITLFIYQGSTAQTPARPFPQHTIYQQGIILPNHISRQQMDDSVRSFYRSWKAHYIRTGCEPDQCYIWFEESEGHDKKCVSEGQGYGMMIVALMAGYDESARATFDALFHYYKAHPSKRDPHLMAWAQKKDCRDIDGSTATDGDMDIAYSLLLADAQWGSSGKINYLQEGRSMIAAILQQEINPKTFSILISNAIEQDSKDYSDMRSSDFMPAHFRAFKAASGDSGWNKVIDNNYRLLKFLQDNYSPEAGLIPDFISHIGSDPDIRSSSDTRISSGIHAVPARAHFLESRYDGAYNFNACRIPWRIGADYILYGDPRAKEIITKINHWIRTTTRGNPDNISAGYSLAGEDLKHRYYEALCFIGPFAVAAMTDPDNQPWLNKLWDYMIHFRMKDFDYYDNSIKMLNLIILSGNDWAP